MIKFKPVWVVAFSVAMFLITVLILVLFGYEISRDSDFEVSCKEQGGVYFISKSNEEYCANSDFIFNPESVDNGDSGP